MASHAGILLVIEKLKKNIKEDFGWANPSDAASRTVTVVSTLVEGRGICVGKTVVDELAYSKRLEYLHEKAEPRTIHRNIKSNNVLLFDDDVAKISNFDLSNQAPKWQHICIPHVFLGTLVTMLQSFWAGIITSLLSKIVWLLLFGIVLGLVIGYFLFNLAIMSSDSIAVKFTMTYVAQGKGKGRDMQKVQCFSCKEYRHISTNYTHKFCTTANAYQAIVDSASSATTSDFSALTTEKVRQMIISAFSTLGLQGNGLLSPSWIIDSGASNHMTSSSDTLNNVQTYTGSTHIQIANGCQLPIHAIGDIDSTIRDVFVSPQLFTSLISVGQLVDNNYDVRFSRDGCLVQDQASGKILAKGSKVGRLFLMHFSIPDVISFACNDVNNKCEGWHKRLGHPNSAILSHIIISGLLGNKDQFSFPLF
ncbi:hypothetical protein Patl1_34923 [Pistacia atlantica]|uniref:Uncharacterized protein n=1 Tax=Pistacia atlantica TaxID=434234 RepID=A0ACC0ZTC5_9ROSI|nr:hypothetical protein Patl1_34923 [Pistacia atlantica]